MFGDYDIERAVEDGATVPIYYESRLAKLALDEAERPKIVPDYAERLLATVQVVSQGVEQGHIPGGQYEAVLIDEPTTSSRNGYRSPQRWWIRTSVR